MKDLSLLIIEDEIPIAEMYEMIFGNECDVTLAYTCAEGIEKFLENPSQYNGVITDLHHPGKNGVDVIEAVRKSSNPGIPVYVVSGGSDSDTMNKAMSLVVHRYIEKPFNPFDLKNKVLKDLEQSKTYKN